MKKIGLALAMALLGGVAAQADTLDKVKASGTVTMGVRDSSGALSFTLGEGKYAGFHIEICQRILANLEKAAAKSGVLPEMIMTPKLPGKFRVYVRAVTVDGPGLVDYQDMGNFQVSIPPSTKTPPTAPAEGETDHSTATR